MSYVGTKQNGTSLSIRVSASEAGMRFDRVLAAADVSPPLSRSLAKRLIEEGAVFLNARESELHECVRGSGNRNKVLT